MVAREPSDTPTEEFVPDFDAPTASVAPRLRAAEAFTKRPDPQDVGIGLFEGRAADPDEVAADDAPDSAEANPRRSRFGLVTSLVVVAVLAGMLVGYVVVQAAGGWESIWVTSGDGPGVEPSPDATPADTADLGQDPSASPSPSSSPSASTSATGTPTAPPAPGQPGETPTGSDPDPTGPPKPTSPAPTPSDSPTPPEPSRSKPHVD